MAKKNVPQKPARDNRSQQLNPQHSTYWKNRGLSVRPSKGSLKRNSK